MLTELVEALVQSPNEAADDVLLEALRLGTEAEKTLALSALLRRRTVRGLSGVIAEYGELPAQAQSTLLANIRLFHTALRECVRGRDAGACLTAMKLIGLGRQGRLTYVLSEGLHSVDETISRSAAEAMVALARWAATETRRLQRADEAARPPERKRPEAGRFNSAPARAEPADGRESQRIYRQLLEERPEIEQAIARAMDVHRGKHGHELLRAALLLADWPESGTLSILQTKKHGGQTAMIRRLQQTPDSEHVDAFLLAATHGGLRSHFGVVVSHISEAPVLDALLRRTYWLKDHQLQLCMHQVSRGVWWNESELARDLARREDVDAARIGEWVAASGVHDVVQDERLEQVRLQLGGCLAGRLRLLRIAMRRPRGTSVALLRSLLKDADERIVRMAAREILRRRPPDYENTLIQLMTVAPESVRRVIGRSVGQVGFEHFWSRFDRLDKSTRRAAGQAMLKVLPDAVQRLERRMRGGTVEQRIKAVQIAHELSIAGALAPALLQLCQDPNPRLRSKAVAVLAAVDLVPPETLLERVLNDGDARVRANAIEVLEAKRRTDFAVVLAQRARTGSNRERANAIRALHRMKIGPATSQLLHMLRDQRPEHRISALWALREMGVWHLIREVARLAREDGNARVQRYAGAIVRTVATALAERKKRAG